MKKLIVSLLVLCSFGFAYAYEKTQEDYKQELSEKGYLYGCAPANWSLVNPIRGGFNYAAIKGKIDIMELEKKAGLDITSCGDALPTLTIHKNQPESLEYLLKNGYNANDKGLGMTYLNYAVYTKKADMVKILLDNGAIPDEKTNKYLKKCKNEEILNLFNK